MEDTEIKINTESQTEYYKIRSRANTKGVYLSVKLCQCVLYETSGNNAAAVLIYLMLKLINNDAPVHVEEQRTSGARFCEF